MIFRNRSHAGKLVAQALMQHRNQKETLVLGLPRGGVVTAYEVACALHLPLDVICPRKVGAPNNPELALGAVTEAGAGFFNEELIRHLGVSKSYLKQKCEEEALVAQRRMKLYRKERSPLNLKGKTVILVDDGLATGATMKAAIQAVKAKKASKIIVAIPVAPPDTLEEIRALADNVVCLSVPPFFSAVGQFYEDFSQTEDDEVLELLHSAISA